MIHEVYLKMVNLVIENKFGWVRITNVYLTFQIIAYF